MNRLHRTGRAVILAVLAAPAFAHEGHGLAGTHWHATDAFGLVAAAAVAMLAIWLLRGGK
jgi:hypothetical protein